MNLTIDGYNCSEYLEEYYSFGLFNATECQELYSHENLIIDEEKGFLRIGQIYDDHDLILGYKKHENGVWGHYNEHWDGTFQIVCNSLKDLTEGWYQRDSYYWCEMNSELQWNEMSRFFKINIDRYKWKGEKIKDFVDYCSETKQLTSFYIKAYKTLIDITQQNGFCRRSFTSMVRVNYAIDKDALVVGFQKDFFDGKPKIKEYKFANIQEAIKEINDWIKNSA